MPFNRLTQFIFMAALSATSANATSTGPGYVANIYGIFNGAVVFSLVDINGNLITRPDLPACAAGQPGRWALDASTSTGQAAANFLFKVWAMHTQIGAVVGTGTCTIWGDTETVSYFGPSN